MGAEKVIGIYDDDREKEWLRLLLFVDSSRVAV